MGKIIRFSYIGIISDKHWLAVYKWQETALHKEDGVDDKEEPISKAGLPINELQSKQSNQCYKMHKIH